MTQVLTSVGFERFVQLPLQDTTLVALKQLNFDKLTPIQAQILPHTLAGQDAIGQAQTGTGKTAAFLLTVIERLLAYPFAKHEQRFLAEPRSVILAPTRELAQQIFEDCRQLSAGSQLYNLYITGGADMDKQLKQLHRKPLDILIGTPGRILDWVKKGELFLDRVEILVLDEADRMLDMGFIDDIKTLIGKMPAKTHRQSLLFSATFNVDVTNLAYRWLNDPILVEIEQNQKTNINIDQRFYLVRDDEKLAITQAILNKHQVKKCIIFANRRDQVRQLFEKLQKSYKVAMLSGDVVQAKRERYLQDFRESKVNILVATDVAGRGIHIDDVTHVINYTLPDVPDDYVHRIGRTARAGQTGVSISLIGEDDAFNLPNLERHLNKKLTLEHFDE